MAYISDEDAARYLSKHLCTSESTVRIEFRHKIEHQDLIWECFTYTVISRVKTVRSRLKNIISKDKALISTLDSASKVLSKVGGVSDQISAAGFKKKLVSKAGDDGFAGFLQKRAGKGNPLVEKYRMGASNIISGGAARFTIPVVYRNNGFTVTEFNDPKITMCFVDVEPEVQAWIMDYFKFDSTKWGKMANDFPGKLRIAQVNPL